MKNWHYLSYRMSNMNKSPPLLSQAKSYNDRIKLIEVWRQFTTLEPEKQDLVIVRTLEREAQDVVPEIETSDITKPDGIDRIITRLYKIIEKTS